jgi:hypothetical protein
MNRLKYNYIGWGGVGAVLSMQATILLKALSQHSTLPSIDSIFSSCLP